MEEVLACLMCGVSALESKYPLCEEDAKHFGIELAPGVKLGEHIWTIAKIAKDWYKNENHKLA